MRVAIAGAGYVGLSNAVLLAQHNSVTVMEPNEDKVKKLILIFPLSSIRTFRLFYRHMRLI